MWARLNNTEVASHCRVAGPLLSRAVKSRARHEHWKSTLLYYVVRYTVGLKRRGCVGLSALLGHGILASSDCAACLIARPAEKVLGHRPYRPFDVGRWVVELT